MKTSFQDGLGSCLGVLVGLVVLVIGTVYVITEARINRTYDIRVESVPIPDRRRCDCEWSNAW
jgi:hypothetical protein